MYLCQAGLLPLIFFLTALGQAKGSEEAGLRIEDAGRRRLFVISRDEALCRPADGGRPHLLKFPNADEGISALGQRAAAAESAMGGQLELIVREVRGGSDIGPPLVVVRKVLARVEGGADLQSLAARVGAETVYEPAYAPGFAMFVFRQPGESLFQAEVLRGEPGVLSAEPVLARQKNKRFTPNDPRYAYTATNRRYQWHLNNTGQNGGLAGIDVNIKTAWDSYKGNGIRIGIVDDGIKLNHADLQSNIDTVNDHDWNDGTPDDPSPDPDIDDHGTPCAGVAAARGSNGVGITGAAPNATLVGLRLIGGFSGDEDEAEALTWKSDLIHIYSNSWGPGDDAADLYPAGPLTEAAFRAGTTAGRGGRGSIYTWAAGNGGDVADNSNYDGYANRPESIAVAALSDNGGQSFYSESGANVVICAPSDNQAVDQSITTTDVDGTYTDFFGGTSSATPLAAGCIALVLQANGNLGWRDVQEILIRSARKVSATDTDWGDNAAGFHFNHKFGAGLIDAQAAVTLAATWTNLKPQQSYKSSQTNLSAAIPDNNSTGVTRTFSLTSVPNFRIEHVKVRVTANHGRRGDLRITLTAPSGMTSQLCEPHDADQHSGMDWTFMSVRHWGEFVAGVWSVKVADAAPGTAGTLSGVELEFLGTQSAQAAPDVLAEIESGAQGELFAYQIAATNSPASYAASGLPAGLSLNTTTGAIYGTPTVFGEYSVNLTATNAFGSGSAVLVISLAESSLANALDGPDLVWVSSGTSAWRYERGVTFDGEDAARSAPVADSGQSTLRTTILGPGVLTFRWRVSSESSYDFLRFTRDTILVTEISGEQDWQFVTHNVSAGSHTYSWSYAKDSAFNNGQDRGWVDTVQFTPAPPASYSEWVTREFSMANQGNSAVSGPLADPDEDGRNNVLEYALRGDPEAGDSVGSPAVSVTGENLEFTYTRDTLRSDVSLSPEVSTTLGDWLAISPTLVSTSGTVQTWQVLLPIGPESTKFIRLRAMKLP